MCIYFGRTHGLDSSIFVSQQPISVMINPCLRLPLIGVRQAWMKEKGFASHSGQQRSIDAGKSDFLIARLSIGLIKIEDSSDLDMPLYARDPFGCVIHIFYFRTPELVLCLSLAHFPPTQRTRVSSNCQTLEK